MSRLLRYLQVVVKWRKVIFFNTLGMTLIAVVVSLVLPQRFTATAQLLPPPEDDVFGVSSLLGGGLSTGRLGRLRLGGVLGGSTPSDLMVGILNSRSVMEKVVERCSIIERLRIKRGSVEQALKALREMTGIGVTDEGIVRVKVEARTPQLAAEIANCYVDELDSFLRTSNISRGRNMRLFIERRLAEIESTAALARESLEVFQQRHRVVAVDEEVKAAIEAYAELKSQLYVKEAELGMAERVGGAENPYIVNLRRGISSFRDQLRQLERGSPVDGFGVGFAVSFESLPPVAAEFFRRYRDHKIQEEAYALLYQQYEYAKILEARDTPALTVLDYAVPPERRSFPRRWRIVISVFVFSLAVGIAFAFVSEYFGQMRTSRPDEYRGWQVVGGQMASVFRRLGRVFFRKTAVR